MLPAPHVIKFIPLNQQFGIFGSPKIEHAMTLPASEAPFRSSRVRPSGDNPRALILVVERNPLVQRLERFFLEQASFTVEFSADGISALERARALKPKIIVSEILEVI